MEPADVFAERVKEARGNKGWTQQKLADRVVGIGRSSLARIESGDRAVTINDMIQICSALGVSPIHMLIPIRDGHEPIEIADVSLTPREARNWIRGDHPLRREEARWYFTEVSAEELSRRYDSSIVLLVSILDSILDAVDEWAEDLDDEALKTIEDRIELFERELVRQAQSKDARQKLRNDQ